MARFISIPVTGKDNYIIKADAIVTALRSATTTTDLVIQGGTGTTTDNFYLQLTHAADTATASVAKALMDAVIATYDQKVSNKHNFVITLPKAVSDIAFGVTLE